jgi:predicted lactoylglutathione lyase
MSFSPVVVGLPIADRRTSFAFYRDALGLEAVGELADDGVPEPLQFVLNGGLRLMLIPTGGFGWVVGGREVAPREQSECLLSLTAGSEAEVGELVERARRAGAEVVTEPGQQPWGYAGVFADPDGHVWMISTPEPPFG